MSQKVSDGIDLVGQKWELVSTGGEPIKSSVYTNGIPFIEMKEDQTLSGNTGCNSFTGKYNTEGAIKLTPGAMTKMYCPKIPEKEFIKALSEVDGIDLSEGNLQLMKGREEIMKFKPVKE